MSPFFRVSSELKDTCIHSHSPHYTSLYWVVKKNKEGESKGQWNFCLFSFVLSPRWKEALWRDILSNIWTIDCCWSCQVQVFPCSFILLSVFHLIMYPLLIPLLLCDVFMLNFLAFFLFCVYLLYIFHTYNNQWSVCIQVLSARCQERRFCFCFRYSVVLSLQKGRRFSCLGYSFVIPLQRGRRFAHFGCSDVAPLQRGKQTHSFSSYFVSQHFTHTIHLVTRPYFVFF